MKITAQTFRGQDEMNDHWIYGSPLEDLDIKNRFYIMYGYSDGIIVKKETIGQFTGMTLDKEIHLFQGDVVKIHNLEQRWKHGEPDFDWRVFVIERNQHTWAFNNKVLYMPMSNYDLATAMPYQIELLGNIHNSPELMLTAQDGEVR